MPLIQTTTLAQYIYTSEEGYEHPYVFTYTPSTGRVSCAKHHRVKVLTHFIQRGYSIDDRTKKQTDFDKGYFTVVIPDYLSEEERLHVLSLSEVELHEASEILKSKIRDKTILGNIDNTTGEVISEYTLYNRLRNIKIDTDRGKQKVCDFFNRYNIEEVRKCTPLMTYTTQARKNLVLEGSNALWKLFEKGELRRLTKQEFIDKMDFYLKEE